MTISGGVGRALVRPQRLRRSAPQWGAASADGDTGARTADGAAATGPAGPGGWWRRRRRDRLPAFAGARSSGGRSQRRPLSQLLGGAWDTRQDLGADRR